MDQTQVVEPTALVFEYVVISILAVAVLGVALGLTKKAVFYNDYNDLGLSLGTLAFPSVIVLVLLQFGLYGVLTWGIAATVFTIMFGVMVRRTYVANRGKLWVVPVLLMSKLVLSVLYVAHLADLTMGKNRRTRGKGWFVVIVLTPLLLALVHTQEGRFYLTSAGRPRIRT